MADGNGYRNWIVNQNRHTINIHISNTSMYPENTDILSWSCLDKDGNAFNPNYLLPTTQYFTTKATGLGSYILRILSIPPVTGNDDLIFSSRFKTTKKYPLDLNFYWKLR